MNAKEQIEIVFKLLKQHLREKKISYRELALRTAMSEANVKRIFSVQSCDLERLIQFCDATEIKFFDLMAEASRVGPYSFKISTEVEEYFCRDFDCFLFFREISTAETVEIGIRASKFSKEKVRLYLKKLVDLGLLERGLSSYQLRYTGYLNLSRQSKLRLLIEQKWAPWFLHRVLNARSDDKHFLELFSTGLTQAHRQHLIEELLRLTEKYREIGISDQKIGRKQFAPIALCIGIGPYRIGSFAE